MHPSDARSAVGFRMIEAPFYVWLNFKGLRNSKPIRVTDVGSHLHVVSDTHHRARNVRLKAAVAMACVIRNVIEFDIDLLFRDYIGRGRRLRVLIDRWRGRLQTEGRLENEYDGVSHRGISRSEISTRSLSR